MSDRTAGFSFASFILTFKRPLMLRHSIEVMLGQTEVPDLLLVVDNGNDEATAAVVEELDDPRVAYCATGDNLGSAGGVAFGMEWLCSRGYDWIHSVDDDDPPLTLDTVERLKALIQRNGDRLGVVGTVGSWWDWTKGEQRRLPDEALSGDVRVDVIGGGRMTVRREVLETLGPPPKEFFFGYYDPLYCLEVARAGYELMVDGDLMLEHRRRADRLALEPKRSVVPDDPSSALWRRYYVTRNYIYGMTRTFGRPDLARREAGKAVVRSLASWGRGPRYGLRYSRFRLRGVIDGYRGRLGRVFMPETKSGSR